MISESGQAAIVAILSILAIIDIIGNSLVCVVITRNPDMRSVHTKLSNDGCYMYSKKHASLICPPPRSHQDHIFLAWTKVLLCHQCSLFKTLFDTACFIWPGFFSSLATVVSLYFLTWTLHILLSQADAWKSVTLRSCIYNNNNNNKENTRRKLLHSL